MQVRTCPIQHSLAHSPAGGPFRSNSSSDAIRVSEDHPAAEGDWSVPLIVSQISDTIEWSLCDWSDISSFSTEDMIVDRSFFWSKEPVSSIILREDSSTKTAFPTSVLSTLAADVLPA